MSFLKLELGLSFRYTNVTDSLILDASGGARGTEGVSAASAVMTGPNRELNIAFVTKLRQLIAFIKPSTSLFATNGSAAILPFSERVTFEKFTVFIIARLVRNVLLLLAHEKAWTQRCRHLNRSVSLKGFVNKVDPE